MEKIPMTKIGFENLENELRNLKGVERPNIIAAIAEARAHGDLSENAEYHAAKEKQSYIEGRIKELTAVISLAQVIDTSKMTGDVVRLGASILIVDEETEEESNYQLVGDYEADIDNNKISLSSPLGKALLGKEIGDSIEFNSPSGTRYYEIEKVSYK